MSSGKNGDGDAGPNLASSKASRQKSDVALDARLKDLGTQLDHVSNSRRQQKQPATRGNAMGMAFRLSTELVAGLVVGGLIGWFLDNWFGTSPLLLLLFFALGAAAGILNVIRTARQMQQDAVAEHGWGKDVRGDDEDER